MSLFFGILLILPLLNSSVAEYKSYKNYKVYEVIGNVENITKLIELTNSISEVPYHEIRNSRAEIIIAPEMDRIFYKAVRQYKLANKLLVEDFSKIIDHEREVNSRRKTLSFSWTAYYDVDDIYDYLRNMSKKYPEWTKLVVGGESYEGRQLLGLRIRTSNKTNQIVIIEAGIHAREWITPATTTYFINQLLTSTDPAIMSLRDKFEWHIFPTVNPDGYHYSHTTDRMWRKTRSKSSEKCYGADPNRNWDYNWGKHGATKDPCDHQVYMGSKPFSEKETRTFSQYILSLKNITAYIAVHSHAQMLLLPFSDADEHVPNYDDLAKIGKTSIEYGRKVNGAEYGGPATAADILYKASGTSMDWVYLMGVKLAYTYELRGKGFDWPPERIPEQGDELTQMMVGLFVEACKMGYC